MFCNLWSFGFRIWYLRKTKCTLSGFYFPKYRANIIQMLSFSNYNGCEFEFRQPVLVFFYLLGIFWGWGCQVFGPQGCDIALDTRSIFSAKEIYKYSYNAIVSVTFTLIALSENWFKTTLLSILCNKMTSFWQIGNKLFLFATRFKIKSKKKSRSF